MSPSLIRSVVALALIFHGLGHALPALPLLGRPLSDTHETDSWILSGILGNQLSAGVCILLNLAALAAFIAAGLSLGGWGLARGSWAVWGGVAAGISLAGLFFFWNAFPFLFPNKVGVLAVNLFILQGLFLTRWPEALFHG